MRYVHILAVVVAFHLAEGSARAVVAAAAETPETPRSVGRVTVMQIGADGKVVWRDSLPDDIEQKVKEAEQKVHEARQAAVAAAEQARKQAAAAVEPGAAKRDSQPQVKPSVTIRRQGSIVVVGPDGVARTQTFGGEDGPMPDLRELIEKSLERAGAGLPEADRARLKQALDRRDVPLQDQPGGPGRGDALDAISGKLDRILERLEKLEQDVAALKPAKGSD